MFTSDNCNNLRCEYGSLPEGFSVPNWFRDFSLPGIFAPQSESSDWELSLPGTKVPWNESSRERMFPETFVPWSDIQGSELYE